MAQSRGWTNALLHQQAGTQSPKVENLAEQRTAFQAAASSLIATRALRHEYLRSSWLGEPVWDILLVLYVNDGRLRMTTGDVIESSGVPSSTALRWFGVLEDGGLLVRRDSPTDKRVVFLELSEEGRSKLDAFFAQVQTAFFSPLNRQ